MSIASTNNTEHQSDTKNATSQLLAGLGQSVSERQVKKLGSAPKDIHALKAAVESAQAIISFELEDLARSQEQRLINLSHAIRLATGRGLASNDKCAIDFQMRITPDIPEVTAIQADWDAFFASLFASIIATQTTSCTLDIAVDRSARNIELSVALTVGSPETALNTDVVVEHANKLGSLSVNISHASHFQLKVLTPIKAGVRIVEVSQTENILRRVHMPANANRIPRNQKVG